MAFIPNLIFSTDYQCETYLETIVTILKQKKMQVQLMRMRNQNQRNT